MEFIEISKILTGSNYTVYIRNECKVINWNHFYSDMHKYLSYEVIGMICDSNQPLQIILESRGD